MGGFSFNIFARRQRLIRAIPMHGWKQMLAVLLVGGLNVVHQTYPILTGKIKMAKDFLFQIQIILVNYSVETTQSASPDS